MLRKPKNIVKAPRVSNTGAVGSHSSAEAPMQPPIALGSLGKDSVMVLGGDAPMPEEYGFPEGAPIVGVVARLEPEKGHETLLRAWPLVLEQVPEARLLIIGEGSQRETLERRFRHEEARVVHHEPGDRVARNASTIRRTVGWLAGSDGWTRSERAGRGGEGVAKERPLRRQAVQYVNPVCKVIPLENIRLHAGERGAHLGGRAVAIVCGRFDHDRHAPGRITLVHDALERSAIAAACRSSDSATAPRGSTSTIRKSTRFLAA